MNRPILTDVNISSQFRLDLEIIGTPCSAPLTFLTPFDFHDAMGYGHRKHGTRPLGTSSLSTLGLALSASLRKPPWPQGTEDALAPARGLDQFHGSFFIF